MEPTGDYSTHSVWPCILLMQILGVFSETWTSAEHKAKYHSTRPAKIQQTRVYPHPLGAGSARPNPKTGIPDPENPLFLGFSVLRGGLRPWSRKGPDHGVGVDPETVRNDYQKIR